MYTPRKISYEPFGLGRFAKEPGLVLFIDIIALFLVSYLLSKDKFYLYYKL